MSDSDLQAMFDAVRQENAMAHAETRRLFSQTADQITAENRHFFATGAEDLRDAIQLVGEGISENKASPLPRNG